MTDDRLRALGRRFRETGVVEDEVAWLSERVRAGELGEEQVRLAAWVGHEASSLLSRRFALEPLRSGDSPAFLRDPPTRNLAEWLLGIGAVSEALFLDAITAMVERAARESHDGYVLPVLEACRLFRVDPSPGARELLDESVLRHSAIQDQHLSSAASWLREATLSLVLGRRYGSMSTDHTQSTREAIEHLGALCLNSLSQYGQPVAVSESAAKAALLTLLLESEG